jgi:hypothetical protein
VHSVYHTGNALGVKGGRHPERLHTSARKLSFHPSFRSGSQCPNARFFASLKRTCPKQVALLKADWCQFYTI